MVIEKPCRVFCCYARKDQEFLIDLKTHLVTLQRDGLIDVKSDMDISPGVEWEREINNHMGDADIILLLISPDFIASDYCYDKEMLEAIARHEQGAARVIPVILRPATWHHLPFGKLQALPKDAAPISTSQDKDTAFVSVTKGIRAIAKELTTITPVNPKRLSRSTMQVEEDLYLDSGKERNDMDHNNDSDKHARENSSFVISGSIGSVGNIGNNNTTNNVTNNNQTATNGGIIGNNNTTTYNYGNQKDGLRSLAKGTNALLNENYSYAKKELKVAVDEIDEEKQPGEAAKANYLFALALLDGQPPRFIGSAVLQAITKAMNNAIRLYPECASYYQIFACIKKNSFEPRGYDALERQSASLPRCADDDENEAYFRRCQPSLQF